MRKLKKEKNDDLQSYSVKWMKYSVEDLDECSILYAGFGIENGQSIRVQFVSRDNDVDILFFGLVNGVSEDKVDEMLKAINECNRN